MDAHRIIEELVPQVNPNASVVSIEDGEGSYRVRLAGTTGVTARCELPREAVEAAGRLDRARRQVLSVLKRCADDVVAGVPDGRG
ncbi:MAG TPA: hypothetical protein VNK50_13620 [Calidithermus sp.]|nr:hypothetical protein [Calidithermus sp.]